MLDSCGRPSRLTVASTPPFRPAMNSRRRGSTVMRSPFPTAGLERYRGKGRGGQAVAVEPGDRAEARVLGVPLLRVGGDLLAGTPDEVPPHHQLLLERLAA